MNKDKLLEKIEEIQESVKQMIQDDIEENPEVAFEGFQCDCCGETGILAGSVIYEDYRLCNDCAVIAEVGLELKKINNIQELIDSMEEKRFEALYTSIFDSSTSNSESSN